MSVKLNRVYHVLVKCSLLLYNSCDSVVIVLSLIIITSRRQMAGSPPNLHTMDSRSACIQGVLKVKVKVKGHVIRALFGILGMSYSVIDGLVL